MTVSAEVEPAWTPIEEQGIAPIILDVEDLSTLLARVDGAPVPSYLIGGIMAEGDYGMFAAEFKAGKTWASSDLVVSVASRTPWLGMFEVEKPGPVLLFAGEGGARKVARRFRAICESRGLDPASLPIRVCLRVPHLTSEAAMALVEEEILVHRPRLVVIDPLYLAARGARGSDLYEMGAHLERIQVACQDHGAALLIVHHWNKTGEGKGAKRMSGAGPDAWGRILISAAVISRHTDVESQATTVVLDLDFQGDEIADRTVRIKRRVWADDPHDLASALHYEVSTVEAFSAPTDPDLAGLSPAAVRVLGVLDGALEWLSVKEIGDALAADGPLKARTIQDALTKLQRVGLAESGAGATARAGSWRSARAHSTQLEAESDF